MKKYTILLSFVFLIGCAKVPLSGRKQFAPIPQSQMVSLGKSNYTQALQETSVSGNAEYQQMVRRVGERIANAVEAYLRQQNQSDRIDGYAWEFNVLNSNEVNAWALPGGKIAFYEGILPVCQDDAGIAVVMGHEIAHAIAQHGNERLTQGLAAQLGGLALQEALNKEPTQTQQLAMTAFGLGVQVGVLLPYSRLHESEADELGLYFMAMAGYDPHEAPEFWKRMQQKSNGASPPEFLSTHPAPSKRIKQLEKLVPKAMQYYDQQAHNSDLSSQ